jgi:hypothetical protein
MLTKSGNVIYENTTCHVCCPAWGILEKECTQVFAWMNRNELHHHRDSPLTKEFWRRKAELEAPYLTNCIIIDGVRRCRTCILQMADEMLVMADELLESKQNHDTQDMLSN